ncbi:hypothetical protein [Alteromonas sp. H39]|uniref:hypothetical protein n=1 Tax=Alteromonas sp. H39 TaxID=3389876 RepID=UPI0039DFBE4F
MTLQVNQQEIDAVEAKLQRQHGMKAAIAAAFWAVPILVLWYVTYQINDSFAPLMLAISGILVGLAVRFHGRGYTPSFGIIAFLTHLAIVIAAFLFGMSLGEGQAVLAVMLAGFYVAGAWAAAFIGRARIPFTQHRAIYLLTEHKPHPSHKRLRNRWIITIPVSVIVTGVTLSATLFTLAGVDFVNTSASYAQRESEQRDALEQKAIDVTSESLSTLTNDEAMRHAYAFFHGFLPSKKGFRYSRYPKSEYKSKRILSFLAQEREHARAQFVLGRLTYTENGGALIQQAAEKGDSFAKIHQATEFGCFGNTRRATELLNLLAKTMTDASAKQEIDSILHTGFDSVCAEFSRPDFAMMYIH